MTHLMRTVSSLAAAAAVCLCLGSCSQLTAGFFPPDLGEKASTPAMDPGTGTYAASLPVAITSSTDKATIYYTTDGSTPTTSSHVYVSPIAVTSNMTTIQAIAVRTGLKSSSVASNTYVISTVVATPQLSPSAGTYSANQTVTMTCATTGATIHYTTDGSTPTATSAVFSSGISVSGDGTSMTIRAVATKAGMTDSSVASATYTINYSQVSTPFLSPGSGTYSADQTVTIGCGTTGATIHYTTDGTTPTAGSPVYSAPITVSGDGTTMQIRAIAMYSGMANSTVASASYTINYPLVTPVFTPWGSAIGHLTPVQITCGTPGASIMYTTDLSTPTEVGGVVQNGILYTGPFLLPYGQTTVIARSFKVGKGDSSTMSATYNQYTWALIVVQSTSQLLARQLGVANGVLYGGGERTTSPPQPAPWPRTPPASSPTWQTRGRRTSMRSRSTPAAR